MHIVPAQPAKHVFMSFQSPQVRVHSEQYRAQEDLRFLVIEGRVMVLRFRRCREPVFVCTGREKNRARDATTAQRGNVSQMMWQECVNDLVVQRFDHGIRVFATKPTCRL